MKIIVQRTGAEYKRQSGILSNATLDRASNAITYRVYGREEDRRIAYEDNLSSYEKAAIRANIWNSSMTPLYRIISMTGIIFILYFGSKNVLGTGWKSWDIAAFTTFLACFIKLSDKSSKAAKLFNAVHKSQVSWKRIKPLMVIQDKDTDCKNQTSGKLEVKNLSFTYPDGKTVYNDISFTAEPGEIIGVTGPVACGKSTFGKTFLCECPYKGSIKYLEINYPKLYFVSSTTKVLTDFNEFLQEVKKEDFRYVVPDFRLNKAFDKLCRAYIEARYNRLFTVSKEQYEYMLARTEVLREVTIRECAARMAYYDEMIEKEEKEKI